MNSSDTVALIAATLTFFGVAATAWYNWRQRKNQPDVDRYTAVKIKEEVETSMWARVQSELNRIAHERDAAIERANRLQAEVEELKERVEKLEHENEVLRGIIGS